MFGRRTRETGLEEASAQEIDQPAVVEHEVRVNSTDVDVAASLGSAALPMQRGFETHESGLLVPDKSANVSMVNNNETLMTDSRRVTLETVEANFKTEQERLKSPLDKQELDEAVRIIKEQMKQRMDDNPANADIARDFHSIHRIENVLKGERDMYVANVTQRDETLSGSEMLGRVVKQYAQLIPENFGPESHIGSMGGTVNIPEDGIIHCEGYNGSILYEFARAEQICKKLETMPEDVRTKLLEDSGSLDASWLYEEPVVVEYAESKELAMV